MHVGRGRYVPVRPSPNDVQSVMSICLPPAPSPPSRWRRWDGCHEATAPFSGDRTHSARRRRRRPATGVAVDSSRFIRSISDGVDVMAAGAAARGHGRSDAFPDEFSDRRRLVAERALDDVLADSFPASDPPSWNPGIACPTPIGHTRQASLSRRLTDAADDGESAAL